MPIDGISGKNHPGILQFPVDRYQQWDGTNQPRASQSSQQDLEVARKNRDFVEIRKMVDALPDVRLGKVNRLSKAIDEGSYDVSGRKIADAVIRKHLVDYSV
jgi:flagellar biosynthesis anti-sigma factor FlgM